MCIQNIQQDLDIARRREDELGKLEVRIGGKENKGQIVILLKGDNQGSIALAHNSVFHSKTKHIDI